MILSHDSPRIGGGALRRAPLIPCAPAGRQIRGGTGKRTALRSYGGSAGAGLQYGAPAGIPADAPTTESEILEDYG